MAATMVDVTADGAVKKTITKEGVGDPPSLYARCLGAMVTMVTACTAPMLARWRHAAFRCADADVTDSRCAVHYTVSLADSGTVVFDSRAENRSGNEPAVVVAGRSELSCFACMNHC